MRAAGLIQTEVVARAMGHVDRAHYVTDKRRAYEDSPSPIGFNATISAPHMHAYAAEHLVPYIKQGSKVLDVGSGSGYLAAVFHHLIEAAGGHGQVVGVEHISDLTKQSLKNLEADGLGTFLQGGGIHIITGDGRLGLPEHAPYDAIHVGAAARGIPEALVQQLAPGGRMFIPVEDSQGDGQHIWHVDKHADGTVSKDKIMGVRVSRKDFSVQPSFLTIFVAVRASHRR